MMELLRIRYQHHQRKKKPTIEMRNDNFLRMNFNFVVHTHHDREHYKAVDIL